MVLGTNGRSGGQWDIWQAVYSPVGRRLPEADLEQADRQDRSSVAAYWREHYDLTYILRAIGPGLGRR